MFPQKRSAPFLEQLRKAATTDGPSGVAAANEYDSSPEKQERLTPTSINPVTFYANTKLDLLMRQQRLQLAQQQPFLGLTLNKLPLMNQMESPFGILSNTSGT